MKLVLAEKPSVAQSIAKVIGATKRCDGYLEGNGYVVSWCVGHLVELANPEGYDEKYGKWKYEDLPILPEKWKYEVSASTRKQFGILKKLMKRDDVESLVCATDAGREGELIFRLVYHQCGYKKPFERLWISSMEDSAIKKGFENLEPSTKYDSLYEAALCRERADWIVGINATRLFSCLYNQTLNVGRVMTPTLAMAVMREASISAFKQESFYTVVLDFEDFNAQSQRFKGFEEAKALQSACEENAKCTVTKAEKKEKKENAPALYDLTSLQRDSNRILGFTAQQTLDYTQSLYEKKLVTYPRTDSRYLTEDMAEMIPDLIAEIESFFQKRVLSKVNVMQVINGRKVSDHHAIIPTKEVKKFNLEELPKGEKAVLELIATRLLVSVGEAYRYEETAIELECGNSVFKAKGKAVLENSWKALVASDKESKEESGKLPVLVVGNELTVGNVSIKEGKTSPPRSFTEDTLLQAMENSTADEMPKEAERKGIGTPATRAGIIEKLVQ
jgi:DNA topoisomerase-3